MSWLEEAEAVRLRAAIVERCSAIDRRVENFQGRRIAYTAATKLVEFEGVDTSGFSLCKHSMRRLAKR